MSHNQYALKTVLVIQTIALLIYTGIPIKNDGFNFLERTMEFVLSLSWMGQFALDFQCYLILSALWIIWQNQFTATSFSGSYYVYDFSDHCFCSIPDLSHL